MCCVSEGKLDIEEQPHRGVRALLDNSAGQSSHSRKVGQALPEQSDHVSGGAEMGEVATTFT